MHGIILGVIEQDLIFWEGDTIFPEDMNVSTNLPFCKEVALEKKKWEPVGAGYMLEEGINLSHSQYNIWMWTPRHTTLLWVSNSKEIDQELRRASQKETVSKSDLHIMRKVSSNSSCR